MTKSHPIYRATEVTKPWGHELVFAAFDGLYIGKILRVKASESLSLPYHDEKTETICVVEGRASIDFGTEEHTLETAELVPGDVIHLPAGVLHRVRADEDLLLVEALTAATGWEHDVAKDIGRVQFSPSGPVAVCNRRAPPGSRGAATAEPASPHRESPPSA